MIDHSVSSHHARHTSHADSGQHHDHVDGSTTLTVPTGRVACDACVKAVEERLRSNPGVLAVHVDAEQEVAHVTVHPGAFTVEELAEQAAGACGDRNVVPLPKPTVSSHAHAHIARPSAADLGPAARAAGHAT
ncbi:MAG: heavy-metal-associated domain-containing protein, partial [Chloroflexota bacterium]|nr:heavy-metal-associated domain-containing protein [Chloroflexota bacterium]